MRRRLAEGEVPATLDAFFPADWPGATTADRFAMWREARRVWDGRHGWPGGRVEIIRGHREVRRRLQRGGLL